MENSLTIQNVIGNKDQYNLAIPFQETQQINPFFKASVIFLTVDTSEQAKEIYKIGSQYTIQGNQNKWTDLYILAKPFLQRLATEAGIQFAPGYGDVEKIDENTWKSSAYGALKLPDGTVRTSNNFKVIDLQMEEMKYRFLYEEKAVQGISDYKMAKDASQKYKGIWEDTGQKNDKGYAIKKFIIAEEDRKRYVEKSLLDAMNQLRANAPQKASTGAILRVIRDLIGIKGTYTMEELQKPFAVARMSFSPDYSDPMVKQMMLQQCMQSVGNLFGNTMPVMQKISIPHTADEEDGVDIPADPFTTQSEESAQNHNDTALESEVPDQEPDDREQDFRCDKCDCVISEKVWNFSVDKYGLPLCYKHQREVNK